MRIGKSFRRMLAAAIAAGTFAAMPLVSAEVKEYEGFGEYVMSDFETPDVAKQRAKARAEQNAMEQAGVYVESYTKVINMQVTHDEITTLTNGILKVKDVQYGKMTPTEDGKGILISVTIKADIDTDDISKWISRNKENMTILVEQNKALHKVKEEQDKKIEDLKNKIAAVKSEKEKEAVQNRINVANQEFLSNQKVREGYKFGETESYVDAAIAFSQAIELNPQNAIAYSLLGYTYACLKDNAAIKNCNIGVSLAPQSVYSYRLRGDAYRILENYVCAITDYTRAIDIEPNNAIIYKDRGLAFFNLKEYKNAIDDYTKAIELNPEFTAAYVLRSLAYLTVGNNEGFNSDFSMIQRLDPLT